MKQLLKPSSNPVSTRRTYQPDTVSTEINGFNISADRNKFPDCTKLFSQNNIEPHHYFENAFLKLSDGLRIREGTPISRGDPNDFPSPRQQTEEIIQPPPRDSTGIKSKAKSVDPMQQQSAVKNEKYYAGLPYTFDMIPNEYNPVVAKRDKIAKMFIK